MIQITYIKSSLNHSSALTAPEVALSQFGFWNSLKKAFKKFVKPLAMIAGIVLSIAVPFIAPMVAGVIFSGSAALATGAIGSAIAGAGLGAVAGALTAYGTGQNVLMGAALGGLGGAIGGGVAGYAQSGSMMGGAAAAGGSPGTAIGGGQFVQPASAAIGSAGASSIPGQVGVPLGSVGAATSGGIGSTMTGLGKSLLEAGLKAAPGAIGTLVSSLAPSDVPQATKELQAEMQRLQNSDIDAYNKAKVLYDQLYARYMQIDPVAAAQLAEANVQLKVAGQVADIGRNTARGAASAEYAVDAETRRTNIAGAAEGANAYTNAYYQADGAKTQALANLRIPQYQSNSMGYLENELKRAEGQTAGLATDISTGLTPFALALAPKDTTVISDDEKRRKAGLMDKNFAAV